MDQGWRTTDDAARPTAGTVTHDAPGEKPGGQAFEPLPSNLVLLGRLERALSAEGPHSGPKTSCPLSATARIPSAVPPCCWRANRGSVAIVGVKLLGLLKAHEQEPLLLALLADKRPVSFLKRMLRRRLRAGGLHPAKHHDRARAGSETRHPRWNRRWLAGFDNPYYEVRAEAARVSARLAGGLPEPRRGWWTACRRLLHGLVARGGLIRRPRARQGRHRQRDALPALLALRNARFWRMRAAALEGLLALVERGEGGDSIALIDGLRGFILTSTDFSPEFEIKRLYGRLLRAVATREGGER